MSLAVYWLTAFMAGYIAGDLQWNGHWVWAIVVFFSPYVGYLRGYTVGKSNDEVSL